MIFTPLEMSLRSGFEPFDSIHDPEYVEGGNDWGKVRWGLL
jgi:hypothetical protein